MLDLWITSCLLPGTHGNWAYLDIFYHFSQVYLHCSMANLHSWCRTCPFTQSLGYLQTSFHPLLSCDDKGDPLTPRWCLIDDSTWKAELYLWFCCFTHCWIHYPIFIFIFYVILSVGIFFWTHTKVNIFYTMYTVEHRVISSGNFLLLYTCFYSPNKYCNW